MKFFEPQRESWKARGSPHCFESNLIEWNQDERLFHLKSERQVVSVSMNFGLSLTFKTWRSEGRTDVTNVIQWPVCSIVHIPLQLLKWNAIDVDIECKKKKGGKAGHFPEEYFMSWVSQSIIPNSPLIFLCVSGQRSNQESNERK